jgi:hypothetical protein
MKPLSDIVNPILQAHNVRPLSHRAPDRSDQVG